MGIIVVIGLASANLVTLPTAIVLLVRRRKDAYAALPWYAAGIAAVISLFAALKGQDAHDRAGIVLLGVFVGTAMILSTFAATSLSSYLVKRHASRSLTETEPITRHDVSPPSPTPGTSDAERASVTFTAHGIGETLVVYPDRLSIRPVGLFGRVRLGNKAREILKTDIATVLFRNWSTKRNGYIRFMLHAETNLYPANSLPLFDYKTIFFDKPHQPMFEEVRDRLCDRTG